MAVVAISDSILTDIADAIRSKNGQETLYKPSDMPDAIEAISGGGITPTGTIEITQNGVVDVTNYASADVNVPSSSPSLGTKSITENGTYNAGGDSLDGYSSVTVNVPQGITPTGTKQISVTENGTTTEDVTNYASAEINVNVPSIDFYNKAQPSGAITSDITTGWGYMFYGRTGITSISMPNLTKIASNMFNGIPNVTNINLPKANTSDYPQSGFNGCSKLAGIVLPKATSAPYSQFFANCPLLEYADLCVSSFGQTQHFLNDAKLKTLILRKTSGVATLANINTFQSTPFASGGSGGTLYVPSNLIASYQADSKWSTILGYTNNSIVAIEGSSYENAYADGTPISA